jgi:hypothetical protein
MTANNVDIGGILDHHCLNLLFIKNNDTGKFTRPISTWSKTMSVRF